MRSKFSYLIDVIMSVINTLTLVIPAKAGIQCIFVQRADPLSRFTRRTCRSRIKSGMITIPNSELNTLSIPASLESGNPVYILQGTHLPLTKCRGLPGLDSIPNHVMRLTPVYPPPQRISFRMSKG